MREALVKLISKAVNIPLVEIEKSIETPPDSSMGDYAFPCFALAKEMKKSPVQIAQELSSKLKGGDDFERIEAKGPYLNFFVNRNHLAEFVLKEIKKLKDKYGSSKESKGKFMIEFSQPNTHKAFHVGHIRGTCLGESLARVAEFSGKKVIRANYSGDTGIHIAKWIWCYNKFHSGDKLVNDEKWIANIYVEAVQKLGDNEDSQKEVEEINRKIESKEDKKINSLWEKTRKLSIDSWRKIYDELGTHFDVHFFESEVELEGKKRALELLDKGVAKRSDEAVIIDLKEYGLSVWVLLRRDGTVLYSAKDIVLAIKKLKEFPADSYLVIVGDEQRLHFQQLIKTLELSHLDEKKKYNFMTFAMVRLPTGKMSSRTGDNILYSSFMSEMQDYLSGEIKNRYPGLSQNEIGERSLAISIAAIKYAMLKQDPNKVIIFNKEEALTFEGDTGPYLLYSYARARSILKKADKSSIKKYSINSVSDGEKKLLVAMSRFPDTVKNCFAKMDPSIIANYSFILAKEFNEFYHSTQVIGSKEEAFRLTLVDSFSQVIKNSLGLLGIPIIEKM